MQSDILIVGGGQCAAWCATTLRREGFDGKITLLSEEDLLPYERPPLSKDVLVRASKPSLFFSKEQYQDMRIDIRLSEKAEHADPIQRRVTCRSGERIEFQTLVLATGGRPRSLEIPGHDLQGIYGLRRYSDALQISDAIGRSSSTILIVGGGWIGLEVASSARKMRKDVVVAEVSSRLCARTISSDLSDTLLDVHTDNGVKIRLNSKVHEIIGTASVEGVRFSDGSMVATDTVIFGIGIIPELSLAQALGLHTHGAIVTDQAGATSAPNIFAGGDVAALSNRGSSALSRFESWENAQNAGIRIARSILRKPLPETRAPWFWSDQHDNNIQLVGEVRSFERKLDLPSTDRGQRVTAYFARDCLVGAAGFNAARQIRKIRQLLDLDPPLDERGVLAQLHS